MRTIAIINEPQECGDPTITFLNLEDGQVVEEVNCAGIYEDCTESVEICELKGQPFKFWIWDKEEPFKNRETFNNSFFVFRGKDRKTEIPVQEIEGDEYKILDRSSLGQELFDGELTNKWEFTIQECTFRTDYIYHPEWDEFAIRMKDKYGIDVPEYHHRYTKMFVEPIAKIKGFEVLNIL